MKFNVTLLLATLLAFLRPVLAWEDSYGPISPGYFSIIIAPSSGSLYVWIMTEGNPKPNASNLKYASCRNFGNEWTSLTSELPWTVDIHPGNMCNTSNEDNLWIKYSNQFLNIPTDSRCAVYRGFLGLTRDVRCIIPERP
ncbi:hypothetical protein BC832DRAFT_560349 [Gaertneriomyces semiglobifer]|nr:hypothetical protein BC832DRAFT_560349 [Gaertneriomyces semiglobifer]